MIDSEDISHSTRTYVELSSRMKWLEHFLVTVHREIFVKGYIFVPDLVNKIIFMVLFSFCGLGMAITVALLSAATIRMSRFARVNFSGSL